MNASQSYSISPAKFAALETEIPQEGGTITYADSTKLTGTFLPPLHPEVEIGFVYNGTDTLGLTILKEGFFEIAPAVFAALEPYLTGA